MAKSKKSEKGKKEEDNKKKVDEILEAMFNEGLKENVSVGNGKKSENDGKKDLLDLDEFLRIYSEFERRKKTFGELSKRNTLSFGTPLAVKVAYEIAYDYNRRNLRENCDKAFLIVPYVLKLFVEAWEKSSESFREYYRELYPSVDKLYSFAKKVLLG